MRFRSDNGGKDNNTTETKCTFNISQLTGQTDLVEVTLPSGSRTVGVASVREQLSSPLLLYTEDGEDAIDVRCYGRPVFFTTILHYL